MARAVGRGRKWVDWLAGLVLAGAVGASPIAAQESSAAGATSRLRAVDDKAASLLRSGVERSPTIRRLVDAIEQSDLVVYVETGRLRLPAQLQFVSATPAGRYLRVSVRVMGLDNDLLPSLAHELQHAVEIAGAPEVRNQATLRQLYEEIGGGFRVGGMMQMETRAALDTQQVVLDELRGARTVRARGRQ